MRGGGVGNIWWYWEAISNLRVDVCRSGGGGGGWDSIGVMKLRARLIAATRGDAPPPLSLSLLPPTLHPRALARWCQTPLARRPMPPDALANLAAQTLRKVGWGQPVASSCPPMLPFQMHNPCSCAVCPGIVYAPNLTLLFSFLLLLLHHHHLPLIHQLSHHLLHFCRHEASSCSPAHSPLLPQVLAQIRC